MAELIARRYAQALFEVAYEDNQHKKVEEELFQIVNIFESNPDFYELIRTPLITTQNKKQVLKDVFQGKISQELFNFCYILLDKTRETYIFDIAKQFKLMCDKVENSTEAVVITVVPMAQEDIANLENKLSAVSNKQVKLINEIDASIVGGILIKIGDKIIDGTIRNRLWNIKQQLTEMII